MKPGYSMKTNLGVGGGILLGMVYMVALILSPETTMSWVGIAIFSLGEIAFIWGCCMYASGKGYHPAWGLLGLGSIVGLFILAVFPDKHPQPKKDKKGCLFYFGIASLAVILFIIALAFILPIIDNSYTNKDYMREDDAISQVVAAPIHDAAKAGDVEQVKQLIAKGAKVDAKDKDGKTPLHFAAFYGHADVAELLINKSAKVNVMANDMIGFTPLHAAAYYGHADVAELLIKNGAKVDAKDKDGKTSLRHAAYAGHADVVELLINKGAKVNEMTRSDSTPLHAAAFNGHADVAELLINKGAKVDAKGKYGVTPLYLATSNGHADVVELLIKNGAKADAKNKEGKTDGLILK